MKALKIKANKNLKKINYFMKDFHRLNNKMLYYMRESNNYKKPSIYWKINNKIRILCKYKNNNLVEINNRILLLLMNIEKRKIKYKR